MKRTTLAILCLGLALGAIIGDANKALAQSAQAKTELSDPKEILQRAEIALKEVKSVRYHGQYKGTGWVADYVASLEGSAMLAEPSKHDVPRFHCELKMTPPKSSDTMDVTAGCDGDQFYVIDSETKMVHSDMDQAVLGSQSSNIQRVLMQDFVAKEPLAEDLKAEKFQLREDTEVGDQMCYQVHVIRSESQEVTWFISQKDWLPRRVDRLYKDPKKGEGTTQLIVTDLVALPTFSPARFKLTVPEGFTRTDDFAP